MIRLPPAWIVGCGNMAGAMVAGWRRAGALGDDLLVIRPSGRRVEGATVVTAIPGEGTPAMVLLGVKPQKLDDILPEIEPRVGPGTQLISILAGTDLAALRDRFPRAGSILRAMPNLPVSEGKGVVALVGEGDSARLAEAMFAPLGLVHLARDEAEFGVVGGLAGSGPAYVARFADALAKAGAARGLDPEVAARLALHTVLGTAILAEAGGESMSALAARVASPRGTTLAGLAVLDEDGALERLVDRTLDAAARRSRALAEEARDAARG